MIQSDSPDFHLKSEKTFLQFKKVSEADSNVTSQRKFIKAFPFENFICFFGDNLTDLLVFDIIRSKWNTIPINAQQSRIISSKVICPHNLGFYLTGGYSGDLYSNLYLENLTLKIVDRVNSNDDQVPLNIEWSKIETSNALPYRNQHTLNVLEDKLIFFGGCDKNGHFINEDLSILYLGTFKTFSD